jgi:hypothetical protein
MAGGYDMERASARMKSYTGKAILVFFLYWLFWLPGFIVNFLYYREAKRMQLMAGQPLPGVGCLTIMLYLGIAGLVIVPIGLFLMVLAGGGM